MPWGFSGGGATCGTGTPEGGAYKCHLCVPSAIVRALGAQKPARDSDSGFLEHPMAKARSMPGQCALANSSGRWVAQGRQAGA
jgi:hypothetical protein